MRNSIVRRSFVVFGFAILSAAACCYGDTAAELEQAKVNVISLIGTGKSADANTAIDKLIADFPASEAKGRAIHEIAGAFKDAKNYTKTIELCQYVLDNWPNTDYAMWSQMHVAWSYVVLGQLSVAKAETDKMAANHGDNPELPWALYIIAELYRWERRYEETKGLYELIIRRRPDSQWADRARFGLARVEVLSLVEAKEFDDAQGALDKLLKDFAGNAEMPETLRTIADRYKWAEKYDEAERLYQQIARQSVVADPNRQKMDLAARKAKVMSLIEAGRETEAKEAISLLSVDFSGHPDLAETVYWFGRRYEWSNKFDLARGIYEQVIEKYPEGRWARMARLDTAKGQILLFLEAAGNRQFLRMADQLIFDFPQDMYLIDVAARLEEERQKVFGSGAGAGGGADYLQKAVAVWEKVLGGLPSSSMVAAWGYHIAADCCQHRLGAYEQAIKDYEKVVGIWPRYRYAGEAQFAVGTCCEALRDSGKLSVAEASQKVEQAYSAVAAKYPDCGEARRAFLELGWFAFRRGEWAKSAENFERALERYPQGHRPRHILYPLGRAYEEMGRLDKAAKVYGEFLNTVAAEDPRIETVKGRLEKMTSVEGEK